LFNSTSGYILDAQANRPDDIMGFFFDELAITVDEPKWERTFVQFKVIFERSIVFGKLSPGAEMVIHQGNGEFLLLGREFQVGCEPTHRVVGTRRVGAPIGGL
jgi:hypothetical protein